MKVGDLVRVSYTGRSWPIGIGIIEQIYSDETSVKYRIRGQSEYFNGGFFAELDVRPYGICDKCGYEIAGSGVTGRGLWDSNMVPVGDTYCDTCAKMVEDDFFFRICGDLINE